MSLILMPPPLTNPDPHWDKVVFYIPTDHLPVGSTNIKETKRNATLIVAGECKIASMGGRTGLSFPSVGSYVMEPTNEAHANTYYQWMLGEAFTFDCDVCYTQFVESTYNIYQTPSFGLFQPGNDGGNLYLGMNRNGRLSTCYWRNGVTYFQANQTASLNTWYHISWEIKNGVIRLYQNDVLMVEQGVVGSPPKHQQPVVLGQFWNQTHKGLVANPRITKGVARHLP